MIELALAMAIILLAAGGLALGLAFGRPPVRQGCAALAGRGEACATCPHRADQPDPEEPAP